MCCSKVGGKLHVVGQKWGFLKCDDSHVFGMESSENLSRCNCCCRVNEVPGGVFAELCTKVINHILILATAAVTHGIPKEVGKKLGKAKCKGPTILHT